LGKQNKTTVKVSIFLCRSWLSQDADSWRYRFWILPQTIMSIWILNNLTIHFMLNVSMKSSHNCIPRNHPDFTVTLMINLLEPQTSAVFVQVIRASWLLP